MNVHLRVDRRVFGARRGAGGRRAALSRSPSTASRKASASSTAPAGWSPPIAASWRSTVCRPTRCRPSHRCAKSPRRWRRRAPARCRPTTTSPIARPSGRAGEPRVWCATLADGRVLRIRHEPTCDGGWIAFHADVGGGRETRRLREACAPLQTLDRPRPRPSCGSRIATAGSSSPISALAADFGRGAAAEVVGLTDFDLRPDEAAKQRRQRRARRHPQRRVDRRRRRGVRHRARRAQAAQRHDDAAARRRRSRSPA